MNTSAGHWPVKSHSPSWNSQPCKTPNNCSWHLVHLFPILSSWLCSPLPMAKPPGPQVPPWGSQWWSGQSHPSPSRCPCPCPGRAGFSGARRGCGTRPGWSWTPGSSRTPRSPPWLCWAPLQAPNTALVTGTVLTATPLPSPARGCGFTLGLHGYYCISYYYTKAVCLQPLQKVSRKLRTRPQFLKYNYTNLKDWKHNGSTFYHTQTPLWIAYFSSSHILHPCQINAIKTERADTMTHQRNSTAILSCCHSEEILSQFLTFWRPCRLLPFSNTYTPTESSAGRRGNFTGFWKLTAPCLGNSRTGLSSCLVY